MGSLNRNIRCKKTYKSVDAKNYLKSVNDFNEKFCHKKTPAPPLNHLPESSQTQIKEIKIDLAKKLIFETHELEYLIKKVCAKTNNNEFNLLTNN